MQFQLPASLHPSPTEGKKFSFPLSSKPIFPHSVSIVLCNLSITSKNESTITFFSTHICGRRMKKQKATSDGNCSSRRIESGCNKSLKLRTICCRSSSNVLCVVLFNCCCCDFNKLSYERRTNQLIYNLECTQHLV